MEAENVVGHSLRFGHGVKNFTAILFEDCDPRVEVTRVIGNVAWQSNHRSDGHRGQLGSNLFFRVKNGSKAAAQVAVQPGGIPYWHAIAQCEGVEECIAKRQSEEIV